MDNELKPVATTTDLKPTRSMTRKLLLVLVAVLGGLTLAALVMLGIGFALVTAGY